MFADAPTASVMQTRLSAGNPRHSGDLAFGQGTQKVYTTSNSLAVRLASMETSGAW